MDGPLSPHNGVRRAAWPCWEWVRFGAAEGFTLVELLTVIAIVSVLAALVFTAAGGASERARRSRCRSELAVLAQALEAYRAHFGEYPQTGPVANDPAGAAAADDGSGILFNALAGRRGPGATLVPVEVRGFVALGSLTVQGGEWPMAGSTSQLANAFLDPWGRRYVYFYKTGPAWIPRAPLLLSAGPDGVVELPIDLAGWDGTLSPSAVTNVDNLSATAP